MQHLSVYPPQGAPSCWGQKYQDGDPECNQCRFNDSCKKEVLRAVVSARPPDQQFQPSNQQVPFPRPGMSGGPTYPVPPPAPPPNPWARPMTPPPPAPAPPTVQHSFYATQPPFQPPPSYQPAPFQPAPPQQQYYQAQYPPHLPQSGGVPDPSAPWMRPGSGHPPFYFTQYPGESTIERFGKNLLLRMLASVAQEVLGFFMQWTWPPGQGNNRQG
jgi:hypothetical protein